METKNEIKTTAGLWIDHRKAIVMTVTPNGEIKTEILSHVETHPGRLANVVTTKSYDDRPVKADDRRQQEFTVHIDKYYDKVIAAISDAEAILIFGPGEAKGEFKKRLEHAKLGGRIVAVEAADKMTDGQIAAKVRTQFPQ